MTLKTTMAAAVLALVGCTADTTEKPETSSYIDEDGCEVTDRGTVMTSEGGVISGIVVDCTAFEAVN